MAGAGQLVDGDEGGVATTDTMDTPGSFGNAVGAPGEIRGTPLPPPRPEALTGEDGLEEEFHEEDTDDRGEDCTFGEDRPWAGLADVAPSPPPPPPEQKGNAPDALPNGASRCATLPAGSPPATEAAIRDVPCL